MVGDLGVQAKILKVLGDDLGLELTVTETLTGRLVIVKLLQELVKAPLGQSLARDLGVVLGQSEAPFPGNISQYNSKTRQVLKNAYTSYWKDFFHF